jgi:hypothetical protein
MLKNYPVYTTLPVTDYARARAFYKDKLGVSDLLATRRCRSRWMTSRRWSSS